MYMYEPVSNMSLFTTGSMSLYSLARSIFYSSGEGHISVAQVDLRLAGFYYKKFAMLLQRACMHYPYFQVFT